MITKADHKRTLILEAALNLFTGQGLQQTSMAQISNESGIAVGTMYHHFKSKDELINGLFLDGKQSFGEYIKFTQEEKKKSINERFSILWKKCFQFYINNPKKFMFSSSIIYSPLISEDTRNYARQYYQEAIDFIKEAVEKKVFVDASIVMLMRWYYLSVSVMAQCVIAKEIELNDKNINQAIGMAWNTMTNSNQT